MSDNPRRPVRKIQWLGPDLHIKFEDGSKLVYKNAQVTKLTSPIESAIVGEVTMRIDGDPT